MKLLRKNFSTDGHQNNTGAASTLLRQKALWLATGRNGVLGFAGFRKDAPRPWSPVLPPLAGKLAAGCCTFLRNIISILIWGLISVSPASAGKIAVGGADFDGDGRSDPTEFAPSNGLWRVCLSAAGYQTVPFFLGGENCIPAATDFDGDRCADPAVFNTMNGLLTAKLSAAQYVSVHMQFAETNSVPVAADFDGDRKSDPTIYCSASGQWTTCLSSAGYMPLCLVFGGAGQMSAAGDYDGDGLTDPCVFDEANNVLAVKLSATGYLTILVRFVAPSKDISVQAGDYDGDRLADPMVYSESSGNWFGLLSSYGYGSITLNYGGPGWQAVAGDYSGNGQTDPAVYSETSAVVNVYFANGADVPDSFQQTNLLHAGVTLQAVTRENNGTIALLHGKYQADEYMECSWLQTISHAGLVLSDEAVYYQENIPLPGSAKAALAVDGAGAPHIFIHYYSSNLEHLFRSGSTWSHESLGDLGGLSSSDFIARADGDGFIHVMVAGWDESASDTVLIYYFNNRSGTWQAQTTSLRVGSSMWMRDTDFVVDSGGNAHVILSFQYHPSEDVTWPGYIYYLSNKGGAWFSELALQQTHSSWDSYFPNISLAVNSAGQPALAAWLKYNVVPGGSDALSQLVYCQRNAPSSWSSQILADTADNYFGSDGGHFTGIQPAMAIDNQGDAHIIFSDLASSHINGYESSVFGQIRYARRTAGVWNLSTLYRQSAARSEGTYSKHLMISGDGRGMDVLATVYPGTNMVHFTSSRRSSFSFE